MSVKRENLTIDMFYASEKANGDKVAKITLVLRDNSTSLEVQTSTLVRTGTGEEATYAVGYQNINDATDPLLLKLENHFRSVDKALFEKLMEVVDEMYTSNLNSNTTWMGQYGLRITTGAQVETVIPESVFA